MTDKPTDGQPEGDGAWRTADAIDALIAHRLEMELAPLLARIKDLSERVAELENARKAGYAHWLSLPHRTHGMGGRKR